MQGKKAGILKLQSGIIWTHEQLCPVSRLSFLFVLPEMVKYFAQDI